VKLPVLPVTPPVAVPEVPVIPHVPTESTMVGVPVTNRLGLYSVQGTLASEITTPGVVITGLIDWGDGTQTRGRLVRGPNGEILQYGNDHVYTHPGTYSGVVFLYTETVDPAAGVPAVPGPDAVQLGHHYLVVTVTPYVPTIIPGLATPHAIAPVQNVPEQFLLGVLNDRQLKLPGEAGPDTPVLTVQAEWGDKRRSPAKLVRNSAGAIEIYATHAYSKVRPYTVHVTGRLVRGRETGPAVPLFQVPASVTVNSPGGATLSALAGVPLTGVVATLPRPEGYAALHGVTTMVANPTTSAALEATIHWGDGETSPALWQPAATGAYELVGSHTYRRAGNFRVAVQVVESTPVGPVGAHHMQHRIYRMHQVLYSTVRAVPLPRTIANSLRS
jgi:hypothetical protein